MNSLAHIQNNNLKSKIGFDPTGLKQSSPLKNPIIPGEVLDNQNFSGETSWLAPPHPDVVRVYGYPHSTVKIETTTCTYIIC
jgi:hypothetical protein